MSEVHIDRSFYVLLSICFIESNRRVLSTGWLVGYMIIFHANVNMLQLTTGISWHDIWWLSSGWFSVRIPDSRNGLSPLNKVTLKLNRTACTYSDVSSSWVTKLKDLSLLIDRNITPCHGVLVQMLDFSVKQAYRHSSDLQSLWPRRPSFPVSPGIYKSACSRNNTLLINFRASSLQISQKKKKRKKKKIGHGMVRHTSRPNRGLVSLAWYSKLFGSVQSMLGLWHEEQIANGGR